MADGQPQRRFFEEIPRFSIACALGLSAGCAALSGCTTTALDRSVVSQGSALMDIQEQMVLSNLELFRQRPHALPWHIKVPSGSVTVNDTVSPSFSITWPPTSRTAQIGPSRSVQLQWNVVPVTEGSQIRALADVYKSNVSDKDPGDPTLPPPTCQKPDQSPRYFSETFEEGKVPPLYRSHGYFNGTFIWVKDRPDAEDCFDQIVLATFAAAPVTSQDRGLLVPLGSQPTIGR